MTDLNPPQQISGDGREIWDWAGRLSEHVHRLDETRRLNAQLAKSAMTSWQRKVNKEPSHGE